ncbi:MAG: hypothetical protein ABFS45_25170, partial [Pseudomonadota bacterium]
RFDEGGLANVTMARLLRHRRTKGAATDRLGLRMRYACSLLYPSSFNGLLNRHYSNLELFNTNHLKEDD